MKKKRKDFIRMQEFVWMYGVVAAFGYIGMLIFVGMCIEGANNVRKDDFPIPQGEYRYDGWVKIRLQHNDGGRR